MQRPVSALIRFFSASLLTTTVLSLGPSDWWICDLLANFRIHLIGAALLAVPLLAAKKKWLLGTGIAGAGIVAMGVTAAMPNDGRSIINSSANSLTVVSYNLRHPARGKHETVSFLEQLPADIVVLQEYSWEWHDALAALDTRYPYTVTEPRDDHFGIALLSTRPLSRPRIEALGNSRIPVVSADVSLAGEWVSVLGVHLQWPVLPSTFSVRNRQIDAILERLEHIANPVLVCGDWNLTPWSGHYRRMLAGPLSDGGIGARLVATWPASMRWFGIPIDHCLATDDLQFVEKRTMGGPASDHRSIAVTVGRGNHRDTSHDPQEQR